MVKVRDRETPGALNAKVLKKDLIAQLDASFCPTMKETKSFVDDKDIVLHKRLQSQINAAQIRPGMPSSTSPSHRTVPGTQNGKLGRIGFAKYFVGFEASVVAICFLVKMILYETFVRVLEELTAFQIRVANECDGFGTFALVATKVLSLVARVVVGVDG